jgi:glycosyltransferase involved in cell wall biosynthesis
MRVVICWSGISGYAAACWRALAAFPGVELRVIAFDGGGANTSFDRALIDGLDCRLLDERERGDASRVESLVAEFRPDAVSIPGWFHPAYTALTRSEDLAGARFVMGMDTPWTASLRQRLARWRLGGLLKRVTRVIVAGERSWQYARRLGVAEERIVRGVYGHDFGAFSSAASARPTPWPRRFLFVGRYVPEKGVRVLLEAYRLYRAQVSEPWSLTCCGQGPLSGEVARAEQVQDVGFVQPADLPRLMAEHGAFVLPSIYEPWGVVIAEAAASGLPVLCSEACGASVELVRSYYSGLSCATGSARSLAAGIRWLHEHCDRAAAMGTNAQALAAAFSAELWAQRWADALGGAAGAGENAATIH